MRCQFLKTKQARIFHLSTRVRCRLLPARRSRDGTEKEEKRAERGVREEKSYIIIRNTKLT